MLQRPPKSPLFPYTTLFRSEPVSPSPSPSHHSMFLQQLPVLRIEPEVRSRPTTVGLVRGFVPLRQLVHDVEEDRKSTRLNSSHTVISYAVFCFKKKKCQ